MIMFLVLAVPMLCKRLALPSVVGLLLAGLLIGGHGLAIIPDEHVVLNVMADIGKLMLMLFAGIEVDHDLFRKIWKRSLLFGIFTFSLPLLTGVTVGMGFGYSWIASLLIGSLLASHTLLGFPIVQQLGLAKRDAAVITSGATIFTDVSSLLVLAVCLPIFQSGFSPQSLLVQIILLLGYVPLVIWGIGRLGLWLMPKFQDKAEQFALVLFLMVLGSYGAEVIALEPIVGAFMVGLAIGPVAKRAKGFEQLEFLGLHFFIPLFFLNIGFQIDIWVFIETLRNNFRLVVAVVGGLIVSKYLAAYLIQKCYKFSKLEGLLIWSLSLPQVAATLAAAEVAFHTLNPSGQRLIDEPIINTVIVLMMVTSILGPVLTERFSRQIVATE